MGELVEQDASYAGSKKHQTDVPYPPSGVDRFTAWVDALHLPAWLFYLLLGIFLTLVLVSVAWASGVREIAPILPYFTLEGGTIAYLLALIHFLDRSAAAALERFHPVMTVSDAEFDRLRYEFTTMPARRAGVAAAVGAAYTVVALLANVFSGENLARVDASDAIIVAFLSFNVLLYALVGVLIYHTLHQLSLVNTLYTRYTRINLFQLRPLYALSGLTARTAIGSAIPTYLWFQANTVSVPGTYASDIFQTLFLGMLILLTFIWPLLGAHGLLEAEKQRFLDDAGRRIEETIGTLYRRIDAGDPASSNTLKETLDVLRTTQGMIEKVPTWPWRTETIGSLGLTILVPLLIWLAQRVLERAGL